MEPAHVVFYGTLELDETETKDDLMKATIMRGPGDVCYETVPDLRIEKLTDAIIKLSATCNCESDLWPYRGLNASSGPMHKGHEYCGMAVEEIPHVNGSIKTVTQRIIPK